MIDKGVGRYYIKQAGRIERELGVAYLGGTDKDLVDFVKKYQQALFDVEDRKSKARWTKKIAKRKEKEKNQRKYTPLKGADFAKGGQILRVHKSK